MTPASYFVTQSAQDDLVDIEFFLITKQKLPTAKAQQVVDKIEQQTVNRLSFIPQGGKVYGHRQDTEVRTIVFLKKYMAYYFYDQTTHTVNILHIFCTLMDDKYLEKSLEQDGIIKWRNR